MFFIHNDIPEFFLEVVKREGDEVFVSPAGGGRVYRLLASHFDATHREAEKTDLDILRRANFTIEYLGHAFPGMTQGKYWNGWAKPYFSFDVAQRVAALMGGRYDEEADAFVFYDEVSDHTETFAAQSVGGEKVYPVGAGSWCWDEEP